MFSRHWLRDLSNHFGPLRAGRRGLRADRRQRSKALAGVPLAVQALEERLVLTRPVGSDIAFRSYTPAQAFMLHSDPTATHKIYLDFDGHTTSGTQWNALFTGGNPFTTPAYSWDSDRSTFSNAERQGIIAIWREVAEDFFPFSVDVTTEDPGVEALRKANAGDVNYGIRVVIGPDQMNTGAGGIAFLNSFDWDSDTPCFTFNGDFSMLDAGVAQHTATTNSHEIGHTLGLNHDGTSTQEYYGGHGTGVTSWGPTMGAAFGRSLTQWSRGEYTDADNQEDDLNVIVTQNGFGYHPDDYGNTIASPTVGQLNSAQFGGTTFGPTYGAIERNTDVDYFTFFAGAGPMTLTVQPLFVGANLDILAEVYDRQGVLVAANNPVGALDASFNIPNLPADQYFVRVVGTGRPAIPGNDGYSNYGSLGNYVINGTVVSPIPLTELLRDAGNNLIVTDIHPGGKDDGLTILADVANARYIITDPNAGFVLRNLAGATQPNANTVYVPFALVTGTRIEVNTLAGNDTFTADRSLGGFTTQVIFNGGSSAGDRLIVAGGTATNGGMVYIDATSGVVDLDGVAFDYSNAEGVTIATTVGTLSIDLPASTRATLEDDGTAGDGFSRLRSTNGSFTTTTFASPTAALVLTGVNGPSERVTVAGFDSAYNAGLTINLRGGTTDQVDFTGPVSVTGGKAIRVTARTITNVGAPVSSAGGSITFIATNSIVLSDNLTAAGGSIDLSSSAGAIIQTGGTVGGGSAAFAALTGVGSWVSPIATAVANLEASSPDGGVFLSNAGNVTIGGASATLNGVRATATGDVLVRSTGSISVVLADQVIRAPGTVTVQALGASGDVVTGGQTTLDAIRGLGAAAVTVHADRDLLVGDATGRGHVRSASGSLVLSAGRNIVVNSNGDLEVESGTGAIGATVGTNFTMLSTLANGGPVVRTQGGAVTVTTGAGGTATFNSDGATAVASNGGNITVTADDMAIVKGLNAGTGTVTLRQATTAARVIDIGTNTAGQLGLTDAELDQVTASTLIVGRLDNTGSIRLTNLVTAPVGWSTLSLRTAGAMFDGTAGEQSDLVVPNLAIRASSGIGSASSIDVDVTNLAFSNSGAGGVNITDGGSGLTIGAVDGLTGSQNLGGGGIVRGGGFLTVAAPVTMIADFTLEASDGATNANNLTISADVTHQTNGTITLRAGDDILHTAGTVRGTGSVIFFSDAETSAVPDGRRGGVNQTGGAVNAGGALFRADSAVTFTAGANDVNNLAALVTGAGQGFDYRDVNDVTVGSVSTVNGVTTTDGNISLASAAGTVRLDQLVTAGGVNTVSLAGNRVLQTGTAPHVFGEGLSLAAAVSLGEPTQALVFDVGSLGLTTDTAATGGSQYLKDVNTALVNSLNAGTGTAFLRSGTYVLVAGDAIGNTTNVDVGAASVLDLNDDNETMGSLSGPSGASVLLGSRTLTSAGSADTTFAGVLSGTGGGFTKGGTSTLRLTGTNTYTGSTRVNGGTLQLDSSLASASAAVNSGGTLTGKGDIAGVVTVNNGGTLAPGTLLGPGTLHVDRLVVNAGGTVQIQIEGENPGEFSTVDVDGTVTLNGNLTFVGSVTPQTPGQVFVLIDNDGTDAVAGTFAGLPQDAPVTINGAPGVIHYNQDGGDGNPNDVAVVINTAPVADAGGPYFGFEGDVIQLDGTFSTDGEQNPATLTYFWDLDDDGLFGETGVDAVRGAEVGARPTFNSLGLDGFAQFTVRLRVTDNGNATATDTATIDLANKAPTATLLNNGALEGSSAPVRFENPYDPSIADAAVLRYSYDWDNDGNFDDGDGTYAGSVTSLTSTVPASLLDDGPGTRVVRAIVIDKDGDSTEYFTTISITNVNPTATFSSIGIVDEGSSVDVVFFNVTEPSIADQIAGLRYAYDLDNNGTFDVGDGTYVGSSTSDTATVPANLVDDGPSTHTVRAIIIDKDGGFTEYFTTIIVDSRPPTGTLTARTVNEHQDGFVEFVGVSDPSQADMNAGFLYSFDFDNDVTFEIVDSTSPFAVIPAEYLDDNAGANIIAAQIKDKDGAYSVHFVTVTVNNVNPTAVLNNGGVVFEGKPGFVSFTNQSDPSNADTTAGFRYAYDFNNDGTFEVGDGTYAGSSAAPSAEIPSPLIDDGTRSYPVRAVIIDKDGGTTPYTTTITVVGVSPIASFSGPGTVREGVSAPFLFSNVRDFSATDQAAGFAYSYDFNGDGVFEVNRSTSDVGSFAYLGAGRHTIIGRVFDKDGEYADYSTTVVVTPAPLDVFGRIVTRPAGSSFSGLVATFNDISPNSLGSYTATITWGDGTRSTGVVTTGVLGAFNVSGQHVYRAAGTYRIGVTLTEVGGSAGAAAGTARITATRMTALTPVRVTASNGRFTGAILGAFVDANKLAVASDYKVQINWGDRTTSAGAVRRTAAGRFEVVGSHAYRRPGTYRVTITVTGKGGSVATLVATIVFPEAGRRS